ncbi:unnamed protein product [Rotaria sordida]|uniref:Fatty acid desaturase domain-containing protein n=1 Tax=Rotaria sordida TaxID=392033 RepID=A0A815LAU0_9BILA|nr:unnamed protein product [Rotaria sordida]CAF1407201.1 unnamed protein product [Rotaria sordida]
MKEKKNVSIVDDIQSKSSSRQSSNNQVIPRNGFLPKDPQIQAQIKALMKTNIIYTLLALICDWGIIIKLATLSWIAFHQYGVTTYTIFAYIIVCFIIASRQRGLECLIHEATHMNLTRNILANDIIGWIFAALPLGHNLITERQSHIVGHHKHFWEYGLDLDFQRYQDIGVDQLSAKSFKQLMHILIRSFVPYVNSVIPAFFIPKNEKLSHFFLRISFWWSIILIFALYNLLTPLIIYWFVPFLTFLTIIRYIGEISEHASLGCTNPFQSTRNNLGWFNEYFIHPHGDGYHVVHHLYAKIPFFRLASAHRLLMKDPIYAQQGHHCNAFILTDSKMHTTFTSLSKGAN